MKKGLRELSVTFIGVSIAVTTAGCGGSPSRSTHATGAVSARASQTARDSSGSGNPYFDDLPVVATSEPFTVNDRGGVQAQVHVVVRRGAPIAADAANLPGDVMDACFGERSDQGWIFVPVEFQVFSNVPEPTAVSFAAYAQGDAPKDVKGSISVPSGGSSTGAAARQGWASLGRLLIGQLALADEVV